MANMQTQQMSENNFGRGKEYFQQLWVWVTYELHKKCFLRDGNIVMEVGNHLIFGCSYYSKQCYIRQKCF